MNKNSGHGDRSPLVPPPGPQGLTPTLKRNMDALDERDAEEEAKADIQQRLADAITGFTGSMLSVYIHLVLFGGWIIINVGLTPIKPWDESLVVLAMIASVEAIFLSTFVLISQNRMAAAADKRAELDLQTNLLAEHEVTKAITMLSAIAEHLGVATPADDELDELKRNVAPERVMDALDERKDKPDDKSASTS